MAFDSDRRPLALTRDKILAFRRRATGLDLRQPPGPVSLRRAAEAGLQDSMPRAALLSLHARVEGIGPSSWEDPALVQLWGPRYSAYVVAREDVPLFSLGRYPESSNGRRRAEEMADRIEQFLVGRRLSATDIGRRLGVHPNGLRYAAPTGRVLIRWDGARQPTVWTIPAPRMHFEDARLELARRYLHAFGPATSDAFAQWAGVKPPMGVRAFEGLSGSLIRAKTPIGEGWILEADEAAIRAPAEKLGPTRLLPSGDSYFLLQGIESGPPRAQCRSTIAAVDVPGLAGCCPCSGGGGRHLAPHRFGRDGSAVAPPGSRRARIGRVGGSLDAAAGHR